MAGVVMLALKVEFHYAQKALDYTRKDQLLLPNYLFVKDSRFLYLPVSKKFKPLFPASFVQKTFPAKRERLTFEQKLLQERILTPKELDTYFVSSFDVAGSVAILEIMPELQEKEKAIAQALLQLHPNLTTVAKKATATKGKYRIRTLQIITGKRTLATRYKENGCLFDLNLNEAFFSPRLSFERSRIAHLAKPKENVLALFAGAGFYPIVLSKLQPSTQHIVAIELNPKAVKWMKHNVKLNKMENKIEVIQGDAKPILRSPRFRRFADRIIMPLPHSAFEFLDAALPAAKKGCTIHFYYIPSSPHVDAIQEAKQLVLNACQRRLRKCRFIYSHVVKTYSPHVDEVVLDVKLLN